MCVSKKLLVGNNIERAPSDGSRKIVSKHWVVGRPEARGQRPEAKAKANETRGQRPEAKAKANETRGQRPEPRASEARGQRPRQARPEARGQRLEAKASEARGQRPKAKNRGRSGRNLHFWLQILEKWHFARDVLHFWSFGRPKMEDARGKMAVFRERGPQKGKKSHFAQGFHHFYP